MGDYKTSPDLGALIAGLSERIAALERVQVSAVHLIGAAGQPAFQGLWVNFGPARAAYYYLDRGRCYLGGVIKSGTSGTAAFTLPVAPLDSTGGMEYPAVASGGVAFLLVDAVGTVTPANTTGTAVATFCYLEGVSFRYE